MAEYHRVILANGLRLLIAPLPHLHSAEVTCFVGVGVRNEPAALAGVSHFLEHMVFRGNRNYPSGPLVEQAFERLGGSVNAATDAETTSFDVNIHPDYVAESIGLFADLLIEPLFLGMETEREIVLEEALADFNEHGDDICLDNRIAKLMWGEHPLGLPVIGFPETIRKLSVDDLRSWHRQYYRPNNTVISIAGPVEIDKVQAAVEQSFSFWEAGEHAALQLFSPDYVAEGPRCCWVKDSGSQVVLQMAWRTNGSLAPTSIGMRVLRRILGDGGASRLMQRLREETGLTYSVDASLEEYAECGCFSIDLATEPDKLLAAVKIVVEEMEKIRELVPSAELQRAVQMGLHRLYFSRDNVSELSVRYGWGEMSRDMHTLYDDTVAWRQVTPQLVQRAALSCLRPQRCCFACVGPWREQDRLAVEAVLSEYALRYDSSRLIGC
ncbi:MAG: hypothetical protein B6I36_04260 [Desulfobacteraceae bacterium 4572_35.1]|nr:MAG: hypothetical protein B6I36_04260 [Desulfobacteraceae bacterium 4572_35.1]